MSINQMFRWCRSFRSNAKNKQRPPTTKQKLASKSDKYGLKIFWLCDSKNAYPLNGKKSQKTTCDRRCAYNRSRALRMNRNVTMNNFFTSHELAQEILLNGLTIVGTFRKNKRFIPKEFQTNRHRAIGSKLFRFRPKITLS